MKDKMVMNQEVEEEVCVLVCLGRASVPLGCLSHDQTDRVPK